MFLAELSSVRDAAEQLKQKVCAVYYSGSSCCARFSFYTASFTLYLTLCFIHVTLFLTLYLTPCFTLFLTNAL